MDPLSALLKLRAAEREQRGLQHTPHEIAQQPETWLATFAQLRREQDAIREFLTRAGVRDEPPRRPTVFLVGAGTSDYIGHALHLLLRKSWECEVVPVASTSLLTNLDDYVLPDRRALWISFSRSGDSAEGVAVLERALAAYPQVSHLLVTCNGEGRMKQALSGRQNGLSLVLPEATNDRGLAMTSSFTNMLVAGQVLAHAERLEDYEPILRALARAAESLLPRAAQLAADLAAQGDRRVCFVGSGALAGAAMESALKVLELTAGRVQTFSQATLALRHGPMAALNQETLLVALVSSQSQRRHYERDLLREIGQKKLVRARVAIATHPEGLSSDAEYVLAPEPAEPEPTIPDLCRPVLDVLFAQLLGLFASLHVGLKPDTPSPTGAISRVVQNVGIY